MRTKARLSSSDHPTLSNGCSPSSSSSKSKKRHLRDENAPKIPMNPYTYFMNEHKEEFKNQPNARDIISKLAAKWRGLTDIDKQVYIDRTAEGMARYRQELKNYKNSDNYRQFMEAKERHEKDTPSISKQPAKHSSSSVNGIPVFSQAFLDFNKSREAHLRKLQREISEVEDETTLIQKNIISLSGKLEVIQETLYNDELAVTELEKTIEKWRKLTLKAMEENKLLHSLHLSSNSTAEELTSRLEEAAKKVDNNSTALRQCLSAISYA